MREYSNTGSKYVVTFVDRKSRLVRVYFVRRKSEVTSKMKHFVSWVKNQRGEYPKNFHTDGGGEYVNLDMKNFCEECGINVEITEAYSPEQNGIAERINRTLIEGSLAMLRHAGLPIGLWEEAIFNFTYIKNRTPHSKLSGRRPIDVWNEDLGEVEREEFWTLHPFGCKAEVHIPPSRRIGGKDGEKVRTCVYLGKAPGRKAECFWDYKNDKLIFGHSNYFEDKSYPLNPSVSKEENSDRKVRFAREAQVLGAQRSKDSDRDMRISLPRAETVINSDSEDDVVDDYNGVESDCDDHSDDHGDASLSGASDSESPEEQVERSAVDNMRRSARPRGSVSYTQGFDCRTKLRNVNGKSTNVGYTSDRDLHAMLVRATGGKEQKITRATGRMLKRPDKEGFLDGEVEEIENGFETGCIERVEDSDIPAGVKMYNLMWVYKVKPETELEPERYRSRLCVLGNRQTEDSYGETFAAVAKVKSFRLLLTLCVHFGLTMTQLDVSNAFMYADLDRDIYVHPPPGHEHLGKLKLNKSLYGLKQAPRLWYDTMKATLQEMGFEQLASDVCCFKHPTKRCYILMYVAMIFASRRRTRS